MRLDHTLQLQLPKTTTPLKPARTLNLKLNPRRNLKLRTRLKRRRPRLWVNPRLKKIQVLRHLQAKKVPSLKEQTPRLSVLAAHPYSRVNAVLVVPRRIARQTGMHQMGHRHPSE